VVRALIVDMTSAVVLHAGAVSLNGRAIVLAGPTGSGKTSLAAWFVANGFRYLSDEVAVLGLRPGLCV
jgi:serine kinase of HPr protein (carbohydrate metabolism regulator)